MSDILKHADLIANAWRTGMSALSDYPVYPGCYHYGVDRALIKKLPSPELNLKSLDSGYYLMERYVVMRKFFDLMRQRIGVNESDIPMVVSLDRIPTKNMNAETISNVALLYNLALADERPFIGTLGNTISPGRVRDALKAVDQLMDPNIMLPADNIVQIYDMLEKEVIKTFTMLSGRAHEPESEDLEEHNFEQTQNIILANTSNNYRDANQKSGLTNAQVMPTILALMPILLDDPKITEIEPNYAMTLFS